MVSILRGSRSQGSFFCVKFIDIAGAGRGGISSNLEESVVGCGSEIEAPADVCDYLTYPDAGKTDPDGKKFLLYGGAISSWARSREKERPSCRL